MNPLRALSEEYTINITCQAGVCVSIEEQPQLVIHVIAVAFVLRRAPGILDLAFPGGSIHYQ